MDTLRAFATPYGVDSRRLFFSELAIRDTNHPMESFVCAFHGRRDFYQVPLALAEADLLDLFITDAYAVPWVARLAEFGPASLRAMVDLRSVPGIPTQRVHCLWGTTIAEHLRHRLGYPPEQTFRMLDQRFAWAAARRAARTRSSLFLYSSYAWEAFTARYPHTPRKVLFQYHPHPELERRLLADDSVRHPGVGASFSGLKTGQIPEPLAPRDTDAWKHADLILCASTFTRRSLLEAGADARLCRIVPYGVEAAAVVPGDGPADAFHAIFVGSGGQRKGLHHLLLAWKQATLPTSSKLTLVCRVIDTEIERIAAATPRVEILRGVAQQRLNALYAQSSLFVMPSLVEGFGLVYLEALAQGCPVLGTANTGLPDLGGEADGIFLVAPGSVEELVGRLEVLARILPGERALRRAARACAERYSWPFFRDGIRRALKD